MSEVQHHEAVYQMRCNCWSPSNVKFCQPHRMGRMTNRYGWLFCCRRASKGPEFYYSAIVISGGTTALT